MSCQKNLSKYFLSANTFSTNNHNKNKIKTFLKVKNEITSKNELTSYFSKNSLSKNCQ